MNLLFAAGLLLAAAPLASPEHVVRIDHHAGPVDARYRSAVTIDHRQVGAAGPGGRPSTLRCAWRADLAVHREAHNTAGLSAARSFGREGVLTGSRPGWCETGKRAIADEVAARADELDSHLRALAQEDHAPLRAELDRLHATRAAG